MTQPPPITQPSQITQPAADPAEDPELDAERAFLAKSRAALARMHEDVLSVETLLLGGEDNDERFTNESYVRARWLRAQSLVDMPDVPLFFGRIDYETGTVDETDRLYVGRRHVHDEQGYAARHRLAGDAGRPLLPRHPGRPATGPAPAALRLLRRGRADRVRRRTTGRSRRAGRVGQPGRVEQRGGVPRRRRVPAGGDRTPAHRTDARHRRHHPARAGRPGPGAAAAVGLRPGRARYRQDGGRPAPRSPTCSTPNASASAAVAWSSSGPTARSCRTSARFCPRSARSTSGRPPWTSCSARTCVAAADAAYTTQIKGDARMAGVLQPGAVVERRYADRGNPVRQGRPALSASLTTRSRRSCPPCASQHPVCAGPQRGRAADRARGAGADGAARGVAGRPGPERRGPLEAGEAVGRRGVAAGRARTGALPPAVRRGVPGPSGRGRPRARGAGRAAVAQAVPVREVREVVRGRHWCCSTNSTDLIERRTGSLGHLVVDEAQDLSAMQLRALGRRCRTGSATVLGDLAQATTPWGARLVGAGARTPRHAGLHAGRARPWLSGAGADHRVRRTAPPRDRAHPRTAAWHPGDPRSAPDHEDGRARSARLAGNGLPQGAGGRRFGRGDRRRRPRSGICTTASSVPDWARRSSAPPKTPWIRPDWSAYRPCSPRAWSSTPSSCSNPPGSSPPSHAGCIGCTSSSPER